MSMPSKADYFSPYPSWRQNVKYHFQQSPDFAIAISIGAPYFVVYANAADLLAKKEAIITILATTIVGAIASVLLFLYKYRNTTWLKSIFIFFKTSFVFISFIVFGIGSAIADEEIQSLTMLNPEDFSTASQMLAGVFSIWLWIIIFSILFSMMAIIHFFLMVPVWIRESGRSGLGKISRNNREPDEKSKSSGEKNIEDCADANKISSATEVNRDFAIIPGLFLASIFPLSIVTSGWNIENLRSAVPAIVILTSFFDPTEKLKKCMEPGYTAIRIIGDGDRAVLSDGKAFKVVPCDSYQ